MNLIPLCSLMALVLITLLPSCNRQDADIILLNGEIYTMDDKSPWAGSLSVTGNTITGVYSSGTGASRDAGPNTRIIDLHGAFAVPGFIDAHVHFNNAGGLINDANLMKIADDDGLRKEISRVVEIVGAGEWITGGLWGAYEEWALGAAAAGDKKPERWKPSREVIDDLTPENPCLLNNFDNTMYLANSIALKIAGLDRKALEGMEKDSHGKPTGLIYRGSPALTILRKCITPKSEERMLEENRAALRALAAAGITEIDDIATPAQTARFVNLYDNGAILSFGSDWPGTSAAEYLMHPRNLIHAAVNRTTLTGEPAGGWFPEEKISVEESLKAYTINNAYAAFDAETRGSLVKGKLADIAVCDLNLLKCNPEDILKMNVIMTIVDGRVVFEK
jgi:predicted amidohydrolase YtcJ